MSAAAPLGGWVSAQVRECFVFVLVGALQQVTPFECVGGREGRREAMLCCSLPHQANDRTKE